MIGQNGCGKDAERVRDEVRRVYAEIARSGGSCCGPGSCCGDGGNPAGIAKSLGYSEQDLAGLPEGANMGLSCGNPVALATLKPGEIVLDLGAGGGFDVFLAARAVGPSGRAIGVDMTPEMIAKARAAIAGFRRTTGLDNVEFRLGEMENLPVADSSVDVVISNCVINLSTDKPRVWREIARVLKPGGRAAVSDLALLRPLPEALETSITAYAGCVAGAVLVEDTRAAAEAAGLEIGSVHTDSSYVERMESWSDPLYREIARHLPEGTVPSDFVTSLDIAAVKPR